MKQPSADEMLTPKRVRSRGRRKRSQPRTTTPALTRAYLDAHTEFQTEAGAVTAPSPSSLDLTGRT